MRVSQAGLLEAWPRGNKCATCLPKRPCSVGVPLPVVYAWPQSLPKTMFGQPFSDWSWLVRQTLFPPFHVSLTPLHRPGPLGSHAGAIML